MDDSQIVFPQNSEGENKSKLRFFIIILLAILGIGIIGWVSYFLGTKSQSNTETKVQISQSPTPTELISIKPSITPKSTLISTPAPSPTPALKTKIFSSLAAEDGFRSSNGGGNNSLEVRAGRNANLVTRGFITFEISDIPQEAKIQSATLRLYQAKIVGNPYGAGGSMKIDHLTYGDTLDSSDYAAPALSSGFVNLTNNAAVEWKDVDVSEKVKNDVANARSASQFRIHFQTEVTGGDVIGDFAYFEAKENTQGTGNTPQLVVKYQ